VDYDGNLLGLQFTILKFSTFTIIDFHNDEPASFHAAYMRGYPDGTFGPENHLTRAEMAAIISRLKVMSGDSANDFRDAQVHWAATVNAHVYSAGYMFGYLDGTFRPDQPITRAEAVTVIKRVLERGPLHGLSSPSRRDVPMDHWAFHEIEEASQDHRYRVDESGREQIEE